MGSQMSCCWLSIQETMIVMKFPLVSSVPDFGKLRRLLQIVLNAQITVDSFSVLLTPDAPDYVEVCEGFVRCLMIQHLYSDARSLAELTGLSTENITIKQVEYYQFL